MSNVVGDDNISTVLMFPRGTHTIQPKRDDGKEEEITVTVDENAFQNLKATFEENKDKELTLDYNHQGLGGEIAGWVKNIEWDATKGVVGIVKWGKITAEKIKEGVIRFFSPAFYVDEGSGVIKGFEVPVLGGLTNNPAFAELRNNPIRAQKFKENMPDETKIVSPATTETKVEAEVKPEEKEEKEEVKAEINAPPVSTPTHEKQESPEEEKKEHETGKEVGEAKAAPKADIKHAGNYEDESEGKKAEMDGWLGECVKKHFEAYKTEAAATCKAEAEAAVKKYFEAELPAVIKKYMTEAAIVKAEKSQDGPSRVERKLKTEVLGTVIRAQADELTGKGGNQVVYTSNNEMQNKRELLVKSLQATGMDFQKAWRTVQTTNPELF